MKTGFDPAASFRNHGYLIQKAGAGEAVQNPQHGYAWKSWYGVLSGTNVPCETVAVLIREELNQLLSLNVLDELTRKPAQAEGQPLTGMLRYNKDQVHGDMHVWFIPETTNAAMAYVIFVREERLR